VIGADSERIPSPAGTHAHAHTHSHMSDSTNTPGIRSQLRPMYVTLREVKTNTPYRNYVCLSVCLSVAPSKC